MIVGLQNIDGSWTEKALIKEICLDLGKVEGIMKDIQVQIVITYLAMSWL